MKAILFVEADSYLTNGLMLDLEALDPGDRCDPTRHIHAVAVFPVELLLHRVPLRQTAELI